MPFLIDIRSLLFVLMAVTAIESLVMFLIWVTRKTYPGFGLWTAGSALFTAGFFLVTLRGIISDVFTVFLANILIMGAAVLYHEGTLRFRRLASWKVVSITLITLMAAMVFYFRYVDDLIGVRIIVASLLLATIFGLVARSLLHDIPSNARSTYWLTGCLFAITSVFMLVRAIIVATRPSMQDFFEPNFIQTFTFLLPLLLSIPWTFCFFILNSESLELELTGEIVERSSVEVALRKSEEEHRLLIETLPMAIFVDSRDNIIYVNPAFLKLVKAVSPDEVMGTCLIDFVSPEIYDTMQKRRRIMLEEKRIVEPVELNLRCLDGTFITVVSTPIPIIFQGQPAILSTLYDITEQKRSEIELQKAHKLLQIQSRQIEDLQAELKASGVGDDLKT